MSEHTPIPDWAYIPAPTRSGESVCVACGHIDGELHYESCPIVALIDEIDRLRAEVAYLRTPAGAFDAWSASTLGMKFVRISEPED